MSTTARQLPRSNSSAVLYLIGLALIGSALPGFIYSFLPTKTNAVEIDLGSKLTTLPGMSMRQGALESAAAFLLETRNPRGLAYTLYGRADAKLGDQKS